MLLRLGGRYILIDPVLSERASPLSFYGPKRKTPTPLTVEQLPAVDAVLISHNHYDHLDRRTVRQLARCFPQAEFIVPLGLKRWFRRYRLKVHELDWWQSLSLGELTVYATPARHWSMRTLWDRNRSLWVRLGDPSSGAAVLFFRRQRLFGAAGGNRSTAGPVRRGGVASIGAYAPRWFMQEQHMDPQQSVALYRELNQPRAIPIHWGYSNWRMNRWTNRRSS